MFYSILVTLAICTSSKKKYLYLGKTNCTATGDNAYLDYEPIDEIICSTEIPSVNDYIENTNLEITVLEPGDYSGIENLYLYPIITISKNFLENDPVTFFYENDDLFIFALRQLFVMDGINLFLKMTPEIIMDLQIETITIFGSSTRVSLSHFQASSIGWYLDSDLIADESFLTYKMTSISFIGQNNYTIIDKGHFLHYLLITLDGTNLKYSGKDYRLLYLTYTGVEKIQRISSNDDIIKISRFILSLKNDFTLTNFIEADIINFAVISEKLVTLTIDTQETVYLPIFLLSNIIISSNGKIDIDEGCVFHTTNLVDISCFSRKAKDGTKIKKFYQIYESNSIAYACILTNDINGYGFDNAFVQYGLKSFISKNELIIIPSTHFEGVTFFNNISLQCLNSGCQVDCIGNEGNGKLLDSQSREIKPNFFTVKYTEDIIMKKFIFQPLVSDVRDFNDFSFVSNSIFEIKQYNGENKTYYKFSYDIDVNSIIIDDNIEVQFDCNVYLTKPMQISSNSAIVNSPKSGISVILGDTETIFDSIGSTYDKQFSKIIFKEGHLESLAKHLIFKNLGSESDNPNYITLIFTNGDKKNLILDEITACKGIHVEFQLPLVKVSDGQIQIDKKTLQINPKFSSHDKLMIESLANREIYFNNMGSPYEFDISDLYYYNKIYFHGKIILKSEFENDILNVTELLYLRGEFEFINIEIFSKNLILDQFNCNDATILTSYNAIYTSMIDDFSKIESIKSPKLIITNIESNQDITIKNNFLTIVKNRKKYKIDTINYNKVVLYIPHTRSVTTLLEDEINDIKLKIENSTEKHRVCDFNIISNTHQQSNEKSKLRVIIDDSIKNGNPQFDGSFGYAFDSGLEGKVVFKEGDEGDEKDIKPDYFPMEKVEFEEFPSGESQDDDSSDDQTPDVPSDDQTPDVPSDDQTPDAPSDDHQTPDDQKTNTPSSTFNPTKSPDITATPVPSEKKNGGGSSSSNSNSYDDDKTNSKVLGDFKIETIYIGASTIINFKPGYNFMMKARKLMGFLIPPPDFFHSAIWVGKENANDSTLGAIFVYGRYFNKKNNSIYLSYDGAKSYVMSLGEFKESFGKSINVKKLNPLKNMNLFDFINEVQLSGKWNAKDYNWPTNNCQHFVASCIKILHAIRNSPDDNDLTSIPPPILKILKLNEFDNL